MQLWFPHPNHNCMITGEGVGRGVGVVRVGAGRAAILSP
jgi:hypothetical protein